MSLAGALAGFPVAQADAIGAELITLRDTGVLGTSLI